jgi:glucose/mannose transport system permease protein
MDHLFGRANLALASAGAVMLLLTVLALVAPLAYVRSRRALQGGH